jgi:uncharacterized protein (TIGR02246 family)
MSEVEMEAIEKIFRTYASARAAGDASLWLSLWDKDGIQMPPGAPARGKDVLTEVVTKSFRNDIVSTMNVCPVEITVAGDWAYSRGTYNSDRVVEGAPVRVEGKFLTILKRQPDGSWKIYRDCFNSSIPIER